MKDPVISRFAEACSASAPLDMRVDLADGGLLAEGIVPMPFSLVGRDDACDVTLTDSEVNPRHTWLQVIGGRVFAVDLGSRTGLNWPGGGTGSGWLDVGVPVRIGPFQLLLRSPVASHPLAFPLGYNPLLTDQNTARLHPTVSLDFRNGKRAKDRWTINRLITLIGRSPDCKIRLTADDIAGYHCGLVLSPDGVWVVDLSGRGVVVNGERMRVSPLRHGAELWIGRFLIGVQYPVVNNTTPVVRPGTLTAPNPLPGLTLANGPLRTVSGSSISRPTPEDEVELGAVPVSDTGSGLPSSHIMADAFRLWGNASSIITGPVSNPILVSGSGPTPPVIPIPAPGSQHRPMPTAGQQTNQFTSPPESPDAVAQLLSQLGDIHGQMFAQFHQSLVLMVQLFGCLGKDQLPAMQRELSRIQELNGELAQLQGEVAKRAIEVSGQSNPLRTPSPRYSPSTPTPHPEAPRSTSTESTALQHWVLDRLNTLQQERQTRWQSLVGMFSGKDAG
jgi:pSer/pThr/pTyr-binding forkhead associated (FHA) protein